MKILNMRKIMKCFLLSLLLPFSIHAANIESGDSISVGVGASTSAKGWAQILAPTLGGSVVNTAVSGSMVPDQATAFYGKTFVANDKVTLMLGTNDERIYNVNATKQAYFRNGLSALAVYAASTPTKAISSGMYSGTWSNTVAYGIGKMSYTAGSKATFSVTGPVIYLGYIKQVANNGQFTVTIDGVSKGTFSANGDGMTTYLGATYGPQLARFAGLSNAVHSVEIEVVSATDSANRVYIDWWSSNVAKSSVYVGNVPYALSYPSGGSIANVDLYNGEISGMVSQLAGDGLLVYHVDVNSALLPSDMFDAYHPNDSGHLKIFRKFYQVIFGPICQ